MRPSRFPPAILTATLTLALFCGHACPADLDTDYLRDVKPVLRNRCYTCHGAIRSEAGLRVDTAEALLQGGDSGPAVVPGATRESLLLERISAHDPDVRMPPEGRPLTESQLAHVRNWIRAGAPRPEHERPQPDPQSHWAFQPIPAAPAGSSIDSFVESRLQQAGLAANPPAAAATLVRRLFLDLHGLPPTTEQSATWSEALAGADGRLNQTAVARLVDQLLASPRYGERWAQHWLDVVRYADTHGYEVNTPRPNAWPYRDYVIRAFNEDRPYDQFVLDQLAGDATGEDAATGFLVAAAVLLPGQIGKDQASIRLARQDALDEIIVGTSASFLGLTIGCARCHDHKFDPTSQSDYYAMQAFFAGVEYADRPLKGPDDAARQAEAAQLAARVSELTQKLRQAEPLAFAGQTLLIDDTDPALTTTLQPPRGTGANPKGTQRGQRDDPGGPGHQPNLSGGKYTWWTNTPNTDVLTWNPAVAGRFRIWLSWGVHGSGAHTRDARYVLDRDGDLTTTDDQTEIAQANQSCPAGVTSDTTPLEPRWSGLQDAGVHVLEPQTRLILRGGRTGTAITADVVVFQEEREGTDLAQPRLRGPVSPAMNVERFAPVAARFVRFVTRATVSNNKHQPCLDEIEVFASDAPGTNIARDARVSSSGNYSETGKHQLAHINDGRYGNDFSWISNEFGGGWVQLEFPSARTLERIEWARDRTEKFTDRLPVQYQIDVSADGQTWTTVAASTDRLVPGTPFDTVAALQRSARGDASEIAGLVQEQKSVSTRLSNLRQPRLVWAGRFRKPDRTHVLLRGDPEQPAATINAHVPEFLGSAACSESTPEQQRRLKLARWIASSDNPLTARVMANRVWQYHFGQGLVSTPSDFGLNGAAPSHPALLDFLARRFIDRGWSVKTLHRMIVLSETYQQSAAIRPDAARVDSDARLLWRFPSRRLEAEAIRDSVLMVSGRLNLKMGGPGFSFFKSRGGLSGFPPVDSFGPEQLRRMVYAHRVRMERVPVFGAFDCPDAGQATPRRSRSTTAIQALNLFNSRFMLDQASALAARVRATAGTEPEDQIRQVWLLAFGRSPTPAEVRACETALQQADLETVCRAIFNSNEFLYIP